MSFLSMGCKQSHSQFIVKATILDTYWTNVGKPMPYDVFQNEMKTVLFATKMNIVTETLHQLQRSPYEDKYANLIDMLKRHVYDRVTIGM